MKKCLIYTRTQNPCLGNPENLALRQLQSLYCERFAEKYNYHVFATIWETEPQKNTPFRNGLSDVYKICKKFNIYEVLVANSEIISENFSGWDNITNFFLKRNIFILPVDEADVN